MPLNPDHPPTVDDTTSRVPPLPQPWSDEDRAGIGRWGHPSATYPPLLLTRVLQRHPDLADRVRHLGEGLYVDGRLDARTRTVAILRTCALVGSAYEWGGQAAFWGPLSGVTDHEADALTRELVVGPTWTTLDRAVIDAVDALERDGSLDDAAWARLREDLEDEQVIELVIVHGWYRLIATMCNALGLGVEDWMRAWPVP